MAEDKIETMELRFIGADFQRIWELALALRVSSKIQIRAQHAQSPASATSMAFLQAAREYATALGYEVVVTTPVGRGHTPSKGGWVAVTVVKK